MGIGHVGVFHALQDAHRHANGKVAVQHPVVAAVFNQLACDDVRFVGIGAGFADEAVFLHFLALGVAEGRFHQFGGKIRGRRDQQQAGQPALFIAGLQLLRQTQGDPAAHRGTDQDLRPFGVGEHHLQAFIDPAGN